MKSLKTLFITSIMLGTAFLFSQCRQQPEDTANFTIPYNRDKAKEHIISINTAAQYVSTYRTGRLALDRQLKDTLYLNNNFNLPLAEEFNRDAIAALLNQKGAKAIRIYLGQDKKGMIRLVLVGVDGRHKDITGKYGQVMKFTANDDIEDSFALEAGQRCPSLCSTP